jgi:hypothetical protein
MLERSEFDFDQWAELAECDPQGFEEQRTEVLRAAIEAAPPEMRRRLEGLQFQVDMERRRAKTPMAACIRLSTLMMDMLYDELLPLLNQVASGDLSGAESRVEPRGTAQVLSFAPRAAATHPAETD